MAVKTIRPLSNRVLVKRLNPETTKGGIFLPEGSQEKPKQGEIVAVGPGKIDKDGKLQTMDVKEGDIVVFTSYAGTKVEMEDSDHEYLIMSEDDVLAILN